MWPLKCPINQIYDLHTALIISKSLLIPCVYYWNLEQPPVASEGHNQIFLQKSMNLSEKQLIWTKYYDKWHFKWRFLMLGCITKFWLLPQKWVHFKYDKSCWSFCNFVQSIRPHRSLYSHIRPKYVLILPQKPNNVTGQSYWNTLYSYVWKWLIWF